jgi:hypothetical protein
MSSYHDLASEFYRLREAMRRVSYVSREDEQFSILVERCRDIGTDWNKSLISVWLHGSEPAVGAARRLDDAVNELFTLVRQRQLSPADWRIEREPSQQCLEIFIETVRQDLSLPSLPFQRHWRPPELDSNRPGRITDSSE